MNNHKISTSRILHAPLIRIICGLIICISINILLQFLITEALGHTAFDHTIKSIIKGLLVSSIFICGYICFYSWYEKRSITEFSSKKISIYICTGFLAGCLLQGLTVFVIRINGGFHIISVNRWTNLWPLVFSGAAIAILEETLFRGIIFRITEEKLGTYLALFISAVLFGALHLINPNSSIASAFAITVEGGLMLGAAFIYSRNLWFPIAIHFAWNFTQTGIFGAITSGNILHESLLTSSISGSNLITGGPFGPEGSIQAMLFCFIAAVVLLVLSHYQKKIIPFNKK